MRKTKSFPEIIRFKSSHSQSITQRRTEHFAKRNKNGYFRSRERERTLKRRRCEIQSADLEEGNKLREKLLHSTEGSY